MALVLEALAEVLRRPTVLGVLYELLLFCAPVWAAVVVGLLLGWAWKPRWALRLAAQEEAVAVAVAVENSEASEPAMPQSAAGSSDSSLAKSQVVELGKESNAVVAVQSEEDEIANLAVSTDDLKHLHRLVEVTDGGPAWIQMMDRSLPTISYQAWRRDPELGPPQYRSRTIFEDATPEVVRDFFWDDEFRARFKWDDMLIYHKTLEECSKTGTMVVHWVRKFPFFCSNREYIIGRRIWELDKSYYCVTKGVPYLSVPRQKDPRRVDLYHSSWLIRPVESSRGDGQLTACEVLLFHHEDMGIPWEIAKLGVRQGMWGAVRKIEPGLRAYQMARNAGDALLRCAFMAGINTKITADCLHGMDTGGHSSEVKNLQEDKPVGSSLSKFLILAGALLLACTLDRGFLARTATNGVARRLAKKR